jgi:polar amino acid transport system substrate-binding protein
MTTGEMEASVKKNVWRAASLAVVLALAPAVSRPENVSDRPTNPYQGRTEVAEEGRSLLNQYCSHCHGPNAEQGERPRDLRRLRIRYGDEAISVFWKTVHMGRMDKGMPVWATVLPDDELWRIYTFLQTIQTEP